MNTSIETPSPFEQNRADAWRKRRDLHFAAILRFPCGVCGHKCPCGYNCDCGCCRITLEPKDFALTIAFGGLVCFVGAGFWYGVFGLLRWLAHAFLF
jgi:hypothetical protein